MSQQPQQRAARDVGLDVVIPGDWWRIRLDPPAERRAAVRNLVKHQATGIDVGASLRHDLETALDGVCDDAAAAGGTILWMSTGLVAGVPLAISLVLSAKRAATLDELRETLPPDHDVVTGQLAAGRVLRRVTVREGTGTLDAVLAAAPGGEGGITTEDLRRADRVLVADYWVERPDGEGLTQLAFSSPMVPLQEALVDLFDTVLETVTWRDDPIEGASDAAATT